MYVFRAQTSHTIQRKVTDRFTLIELLVIITVICIFSTILLPLFHHISLRTRSLACRDSLYQLNRANILYAESYDCFSPSAYRQRYWHGQKGSEGNYAKIDFSKGYLYPFIENPALFVGCPELKTFIPSPGHPAFQKGGFGFGYNLNIGSRCAVSDEDLWEDKCQSSGVTRQDIKKPKETVFFSDTASRVDEIGESSIKGVFAENSQANSFYTINRNSFSVASMSRRSIFVIKVWPTLRGETAIFLRRRCFTVRGIGENRIWGSLVRWTIPTLSRTQLQSNEQNRKVL